jgi:predicted regulator of Ras-like GTPase activity (Roadblock/LC7/MglB family)
MQGLLRDMSVADLIQHACQDAKTARLDVEQGGRAAQVFFDNGQVTHAELGDIEGEDVIYEIFDWSEGSFTLESAERHYKRTILRSHAALLLEGARRVDERGRDDLGLTAARGTVLAPEGKAGGTEEDAMSDIAQALAQIDGVAGAVLVAEDGVVLGYSLEGDPDKEGAVAAFVGAAAVQAAEVMSLGAFKRASVGLTAASILVLRHRDYYIGLIIEEGGSPSLVTTRAEAYLDGVK